MKHIKDNYGNPEVIIGENGYADKGELCDVQRVKYYSGHLNAVWESIHYDKVNLTSYHAWSLMDVFEWNSGYTYDTQITSGP